MNDLISREALLAELQRELDYEQRVDHVPIPPAYAFKIAIKRAKQLPDAERKHGTWLVAEEEDHDWGGLMHVCFCSVCGWEERVKYGKWFQSPYCPNCGARMDEQLKQPDSALNDVPNGGVAVSRSDVVRCRKCVHRGDVSKCPMCHEGHSYDEEYGDDYWLVDNTVDDGFCHIGKARDSNGKT